MTSGSLITAIFAISMPQHGQSSGSTSQMRLISSRHVADATGRRAGVVNRSVWPTIFHLSLVESYPACFYSHDWGVHYAQCRALLGRQKINMRLRRVQFQSKANPLLVHWSTPAPYPR